MIKVAGLDLQPASKVEDDYGKFLIHGLPGTGKTTLASSIAELGPTLYLDFPGEKGIKSFRGASYEKNITVARPDSVEQLDDLFWELEKGNHGFKAVVIDSLSAFQTMLLRYLTGNNERLVREISLKNNSRNGFQIWGQALEIMKDMFTFWYGLADAGRKEPMHVVMVSQTKPVEMDGNPTGEYTLELQRGAIPEALKTPDFIFYTDLEIPEGSSNDAVPQHIVRVGKDLRYRTKARESLASGGKVPAILGRKSRVTLGKLSRLYPVGGVPKKTEGATKAASTTSTGTESKNN